jgi:bifunctional ADP-heptose synthase (sugar kinase/adenylyltransferase)
VRLVGSSGEILFRHDDETMLSLNDGYDWCREEAKLNLSKANAVLLSDYDKGFLRADFIHNVVHYCRLCNVPCVVDAKRAPEYYTGATVKANEEWDRKYPAFATDVVTRGRRAPVVQGDHDLTDYPDVKCVNHVGSGDCFAAHLTLALACGFSLKEGARIAHSAGRVYVQHPHNRAPWPDEVAADLEGNVGIQ